MYKVVWKDRALKDLAKIDHSLGDKIKEKVENYLAKGPINRGEPLSYQYKGLYRYRFSDYRVIYEIKENELMILILEVGHRREIYQ